MTLTLTELLNILSSSVLFKIFMPIVCASRQHDRYCPVPLYEKYFVCLDHSYLMQRTYTSLGSLLADRYLTRLPKKIYEACSLNLALMLVTMANILTKVYI